MLKPDPVLAFLSELRYSVPDAEKVFRYGNCFKLWRLLRTVWPEAVAYYDGVEGHVYVRIGENYYDIRGKRLRGEAGLYRLLDEPRIFRQAFRWCYS